MPVDRPAAKRSVTVRQDSVYDEKPSTSRRDAKNSIDKDKKATRSNSKDSSRTRDASQSRKPDKIPTKHDGRTKVISSKDPHVSKTKSVKDQERIAKSRAVAATKQKEPITRSKSTQDKVSSTGRQAQVKGSTMLVGDATPRRSQLSYHKAPSATENNMRASKPAGDMTKQSRVSTKPLRETTGLSRDAVKPSRETTKPSRETTKASRGTAKSSRETTKQSRDSTKQHMSMKDIYSSGVTESKNARATGAKSRVNSQSTPLKTKYPEGDSRREGTSKNNRSGLERQEMEVPVEAISRLGRDRTRTRTLSPGEIKMIRHAGQQQAGSAHASRDSQPETSKGEDDDSKEEDDYNYSDDFEDYESDFEDISESEMDADLSDGNSEVDLEEEGEDEKEGMAVVLGSKQKTIVIEEEKKLDSGSYDLAERRRRGKQMQDIKVALDRENSAVDDSRSMARRLSLNNTVATDEGFEDEQTDSLLMKPKASHAINFASARKRQKELKVTARARRRGEELLDMIRLDSMSYALCDVPPVPYEVYMKSFGRSNTHQACAQTNEDDLSEEVQTEDILTCNKWTQKPISFRTKTQVEIAGATNVTVFSQDHLGVGGDKVEEDSEAWKERIKVNSIRLNEFLSSAGQVVLILLEEAASKSGQKLKKNATEIEFSDGYIPLDVHSVPFLINRPISCLQFAPHQPTVLLSVHKGIELDVGEEMDPTLCRCVICVWSSREPSSPRQVLVAPGEVTACCWEPRGSLVVGGLADGALCLWDLREPSLLHHVVADWLLRSPTYNTAEILKNQGHQGQVVALEHVTSSENSSEVGNTSDLAPSQVCSLDETGLVVVWTVVQGSQSGVRSGMCDQDLGLAHWGRVRLVCSAVVDVVQSIGLDHPLRESLQCRDLRLSGQHVLVATSSGGTAHALRDGGRVRPRSYMPDGDGLTAADCLELCPFGQPYFLVGGADGSVRLHCLTSGKPLLTIAGTGDAKGQGAGVSALQWSQTRPFVFFLLDSVSRIHVWDLSMGDVYPLCTIPFINKVLTTMCLSPTMGHGRDPAQLALGTAVGQIELHQVNKQFGYQSSRELNKELTKFSKYTNNL